MIANRIVEKNRVATPTGNPNYLWGWGYKYLVNNTFANVSSPILSWSNNWLQVSHSPNFACGIKNTGTLWCWGNNSDGQLGLNDTYSRSCPVQVGSDTSWEKVVCGTDHVLALKRTGLNLKLFSWGANANGQLGNGTYTKASSPTQVGGNNWIDISAGQFFSLGVTDGGRIFGWGRNDKGQLGIGNPFTPQPNPVQEYLAKNDWIKCVAGYSSSFAIDSNNYLYSWGNNPHGVLGLNSYGGYRYRPYYVGRDFVDVTTAGFSAAGIKTDGTLWSWGNSYYGQLGLGNTMDYFYPKQVGSDTDWKSVRMIGDGESKFVIFFTTYYSPVTTFGLKQGDGTAYNLYSCGLSTNGLNGRNNFSNYYFTQVGSEKKWVGLSFAGPGIGYTNINTTGMLALKKIST